MFLLHPVTNSYDFSFGTIHFQTIIPSHVLEIFSFFIEQPAIDFLVILLLQFKLITNLGASIIKNDYLSTKLIQYYSRNNINSWRKGISRSYSRIYLPETNL